MWNYDLLKALEAVCREGSFERAARSLHITQSAVSQRVRALEDSVGQRVINRGPPVAPTQLGERLMAHVQQVSLLEAELEKGLNVASDGRGGRIAIAVNADSLALWFLEALAPVLKERSIFIELLVDDERFTHELLERGQVVGCVSVRSSTYPGCERTYLGAMRYYCAATPAYVKKYFKDGFTVESIANAPTVAFNRKDDILDRILETAFKGEPVALRYNYIPSTEQLCESIKAGINFGPVPHLQWPKKGLKKLLPEHFDVPLYWHGWRTQSPLLQAVQAAIVRHAAEVLLHD